MLIFGAMTERSIETSVNIFKIAALGAAGGGVGGYLTVAPFAGWLPAAAAAGVGAILLAALAAIAAHSGQDR